MKTPAHTFRAIVTNWLTDVRRRGADLYAQNEGSEVQYFSFEGKNHVRFGIDVDYDLNEITVQTTEPNTAHVGREKLALNDENLRTLAKRITSVREGYACIPTPLLAQLAILCHAYERLVQDLDQVRGIHTTTNTVKEIEAELRCLLTPEEQQRTDNPLLTARRKLQRGTTEAEVPAKAERVT